MSSLGLISTLARAPELVSLDFLRPNPLYRTTRATPGFFHSVDGLPRLARIDEPRYERAGLLQEALCSNRVGRSEGFALPTWSLGAGVTRAGDIPFGDITLTGFKERAGTAARGITLGPVVSIVAGIRYTFSFYGTQADFATTHPRALVQLIGAAGEIRISFFPTDGAASGTFGTLGSDGVVGSESLAKGVYRFFCTFTATATEVLNLRFIMAISGSVTAYNSDGNGGFRIGGVNFTEGEMSSYIRSPDAVSVTRGQDELVATLENRIPAVGATIYFGGVLSGAALNWREILRWSSGSDSDRIVVNAPPATSSSGAKSLSTVVRTGGVEVYASPSRNIATDGTFRFGLRLSPSSSRMAVNAVLGPTSSGSGVMPPVSIIEIKMLEWRRIHLQYFKVKAALDFDATLQGKTRL